MRVYRGSHFPQPFLYCRTATSWCHMIYCSSSDIWSSYPRSHALWSWDFIVVVHRGPSDSKKVQRSEDLVELILFPSYEISLRLLWLCLLHCSFRPLFERILNLSRSLYVKRNHSHRGYVTSFNCPNATQLLGG